MKHDNALFRGTIGLIALIGGLAGFFALFYIEIPVGNRDAMMLALGLVLGWASSVIASEFGSTSTGRKIADSAIRNSEKLTEAATTTAPTDVNVVNTPDAPVPVADNTLNLDEGMKQ